MHLERLGRDRDLAIVFQIELRQSTKFMERFSATYLREYLGIIRDVIAEGQAKGLFRKQINPTLAAKVLFGALDEMATNWVLSRRKYSLRRKPMPAGDCFVGGWASDAPTPRGGRPWRGYDGGARAAHSRMRRVRRCCSDVTPEAAAPRMDRAKALKPDPFSPLKRQRSSARAASTRIWQPSLGAIGSLKRSSNGWMSRHPLFARVESHRRAERGRQLEQIGIPIAALAGECRKSSGVTSSAHIFQSASYLDLVEVSHGPTTGDPAIVQLISTFAVAAGARRRGCEGTRQTSSRTISACTA